MRIVYVLTSLGAGGAERQALALADRMAARGHSVAIIALLPAVAEQWTTSHRVVHLDIRKSPLSIIAGTARARRYLREFRPDLLHSHSFHANMMARLLKLLSPSLKVVATVHNVYEGRWYRMLAYRLTDSLTVRTTAVSQAAADRFVRLKAVRPDKCSPLSNGIDVAEFVPDTDRRNRTREELRAGNSFIWLAAGRLVPAKDYPNLLRAFRLVRAAYPDTQLWIAGAPADAAVKQLPDGSSAYGNAFAGERGSMEHVHLLGMRRDMPALLDAADAFVQSSAWEGMPLATGEAMAMGKPVVGTDAGGTREIVGHAGIVVPTNNSGALADAMLNLMHSSNELRASLGRSARARIEQQFSMDARADQWDSLYRTIMDTRA